MYSYFVEDAYHMDTELDGEVIGIDIVDTAGQVRPRVTHIHSCTCMYREHEHKPSIKIIMIDVLDTRIECL